MPSSSLTVARMPATSESGFTAQERSLDRRVFSEFRFNFQAQFLMSRLRRMVKCVWRCTGTLDVRVSSSRRNFLRCRRVGERRDAHLESPSDILTYRYVANCCINSRLYEPTGIRLTTALQTLTAINAGYERIARYDAPVLKLDACQKKIVEK